MKMTTDISKSGIADREAAGVERRKRRVIAFSLMCGSAVALLLGGCVAGDYSGAYYAPDYGPYYGDYGYTGDPYYGYDPGYYGGYAIGSTRYHRHFGHHHFANDFGRSRGPSVRTAPPTTTRISAPRAPHAPHAGKPASSAEATAASEGGCRLPPTAATGKIAVVVR